METTGTTRTTHTTRHPMKTQRTGGLFPPRQSSTRSRFRDPSPGATASRGAGRGEESFSACIKKLSKLRASRQSRRSRFVSCLGTGLCRDTANQKRSCVRYSRRTSPRLAEVSTDFSSSRASCRRTRF